MKMLVADPAASSHNKFRIQLDYMTFEPIIEDEQTHTYENYKIYIVIYIADKWYICM